jgi:hypothetical protein
MLEILISDTFRNQKTMLQIWEGNTTLHTLFKNTIKQLQMRPIPVAVGSKM